MWTGCTDAGELCVWHLADLEKPFQRIQLPDCTSVICMIRVKNQVRKKTLMQNVYYIYTRAPFQACISLDLGGCTFDYILPVFEHPIFLNKFCLNTLVRKFKQGICKSKLRCFNKLSHMIYIWHYIII